MNANARPILAIFETKLRLEVPLFQRQYVWTRERQWEPLWDDISRKFTDYLEGRKDAPVHFLGAMVLDQKQTPTTHVEKRQVIDGQQRLMTLQAFLAAFRDFCNEQGSIDLAGEAEAFTLNRGMMADPEVDKFKVWPTFSDRPYFIDIISSGSPEEVERRHPLIRKKYARKPDPRPRLVDAYLFFYQALRQYFVDCDPDQMVAPEVPLSSRLEECFQSLKDALKVVVIDLAQDDDAQVIFESLNARGEPLLPADLLRNYIFLRAARQGEPQEKLYEKYWKRFDSPFWRTEIRQGRLTRPRSDLFMQHFLASERTEDIPIRHLYAEYKYWIERFKPFQTIEDELRLLSSQRRDFKRILSPARGDVLFEFASFLQTFDISTVLPLLLYLARHELPHEEWDKTCCILESYVVRRAVCGGTTKNYNRVFLRLIRFLQQQDEPTADAIHTYLSRLPNDSGEWPTDVEFSRNWLIGSIYLSMAKPRMVYILQKLSNSYMTPKSEDVQIDGQLSIEHLMPQRWIENWPLADGSNGMDWYELSKAEEGSARAKATRRRESLIHTIGNLTILTQPLNSAVSNSAWSEKKGEILKSSILPLNGQLYDVESWGEAEIEERGKELLKRAKGIWIAPRTSSSNAL